MRSALLVFVMVSISIPKHYIVNTRNGSAVGVELASWRPHFQRPGLEGGNGLPDVHAEGAGRALHLGCADGPHGRDGLDDRSNGRPSTSQLTISELGCPLLGRLGVNGYPALLD